MKKDEISAIESKIAKVGKNIDALKKFLRLCRTEQEKENRKSDEKKIEDLLKGLG